MDCTQNDLLEDIRFIENTRRNTINVKKGIVDKSEYVHDLRILLLHKYGSPDKVLAEKNKKQFIEKYGFWNWWT